MTLPIKYRISLEQMRIAAAKYRVPRMNPCIDHIERVFIAMENTNCDYILSRKYIREMDECLANNPANAYLREKKTTMHTLNQYLNQKKHKKK